MKNRLAVVFAGGLILFAVTAFCEDLKGMVRVEGGTFTMGDSFGDGNKEEKPTFQVKLSGFSMARTEVTQKEFQDLMGYNPTKGRHKNLAIGDLFPAAATWSEAVVWCNEKSKREGLPEFYRLKGIKKDADGSIATITAVSVADWKANGYRLPTEAEWEYAAKGGKLNKGFKYSGGNNPDLVAWFGKNSKSKTHPVGTKQANELGLYDMSGNVYEWCWDMFDSHEYWGKSIQIDPRGASSGSRILRGGSWGSGDLNCRSSARIKPAADYRYSNVGFRPVRSAQ